MSITHQAQVIGLPAAADQTEAEGCFVKVTNGKAAVTTANTAAADVVGVIVSGNEKDQETVVALPGHSGIVQVALHGQAGTVTVGTPLYLGASGTVTTGTSGTKVAVALANGAAGTLVEARLVEPVDVAAAGGGAGGNAGDAEGDE